MFEPNERLRQLNRRIIACKACGRLVEWRTKVGLDPPKQYRGWKYWSKPLPGFGDPRGKLMIVGLAPASHGGNRTGRMFTGDRSATFLFKALYKAGLASQPDSRSADDGQSLLGAYLTAVVRCAPPYNKPSTGERDNCIPYLVEEILVVQPAAILCLGRFAWDGVLRATKLAGGKVPSPKPRFFHGAVSRVQWPTRLKEDVVNETRKDNDRLEPVALFGSYHPSQQNTFTGKLTEEMFETVLGAAIQEAQRSAGSKALP